MLILRTQNAELFEGGAYLGLHLFKIKGDDEMFFLKFNGTFPSRRNLC